MMCFVMERLRFAMQLSLLYYAFRVTALSTMPGLQSDVAKSLSKNEQLKMKQENKKMPAKQKIQHGLTAE